MRRGVTVGPVLPTRRRQAAALGTAVDPAVIAAERGKLRITLRTTGGTPHDLEVRPAKINTGLLVPVQQHGIESTLTNGRYDFVCTFHETSNMVGVIDVS